MYYRDYPIMNGHDFGWGVMVMVLILVVSIVIVSAIVLGISRGNGVHVGKMTSSLDIAKERYAKGEITKQEFEQLKKDLK